MSDWILTVNAGSSSLKLAAFVAEGEELLRVAEANVRSAHSSQASLEQGLAQLGRSGDPARVGHRIVHGGSRFHEPTLLDDAVLDEIRELVPLAPLHLPAALDLVAQARSRWPEIPHVGSFDTAFFADLPDVAVRLPLPARFPEVRRYGFHGLSYESVRAALGTELPARAVFAHLGSGASLAALSHGKPVDTTMAFTPLGGIVMGTRPGDLDPGAILYLLQERGLSAAELADLLAHDSGLRALAGESDTRVLLERRSHDPQADLALRVFVRSVQKAVGGFAAVLGGLDLLVFTGGIGEHQAPLRDEICAGLAHLHCAVKVVPAQEDLVLARQARAYRAS